MHKWQPQEMGSQAGKLAIITGANSGIGFHAARHLAKAGAHVVLACRSSEKAEAAKAEIAREAPADRVEGTVLDLADLDSVRAFAEKFLSSSRPLHVLINNAGVMALPTRQTTKQGFETQFGTNFVGHFALTGLLLPAMLGVGGSRVVTVSSIAHKRGRINFDDLQAERKYKPRESYNQSKLADLIFGLELDRRLKRAGKQTQSIIAHPGVAATNIVASGPGSKGGPQRWIGELVFLLAGQSQDRGSWPLLYAATSPAARGGGYYGPDGVMEVRGTPVEVKPEPQALDPQTAERLWRVGEELTGVRYTELAAQ